MFKFIVLFLLSLNAVADEWTRADTTREAVYMVFHVADWAQTRNIARLAAECTNLDIWGRPRGTGSGKCSLYVLEQNPILGKVPSREKVDAYFLLTGVAHYLIARELPTKYRSAFQYITIGMEGNQVHRNFKLGIGVEF